jgi:hypothetical protein
MIMTIAEINFNNSRKNDTEGNMGCIFKDCDCETLLMFFLLLVVLFDNMGFCSNEDDSILLFFFLLLIILFNDGC